MDSSVAGWVEALRWAGFEDAMVALLAVGDAAVPALIDAAADRGGARAAAVLQAEIDRAMPVLRARLQSPDRARGWAAVAVLAYGARGEDPLFRRLGVVSRPDRLSAVVLGAERTRVLLREVAPEGIAALADPVPEVVIAAVGALVAIADRRAVQPLIAVLVHPDADVRAAAVSALGYLHDRAATLPLLSVALDPATPSSTRSTALHALGLLADPAAVAPLLELLEGADPDLASGVMYTLGAIGDPRVLSPLLARLEDRDRTVREGAAAALGSLGDRRALPALQVRRRRGRRRERRQVQLAIARVLEGRKG